MSEYIEVTEPVALDSTLQTLVSAVQDLSEAVAPTNVYVDIAATLSVGGWSNATPSVYTLTDSKITGTCEIEVFFAPGAESNPTPYVEFEKGVGSVIFYAPSKPTMDLPVIVRVINAEASIASNIDATMVSTNAISGASNVQQALGSVNTSISALNSKITSMIEYGNCTYEQNWRGANDRYLRYSIIKDANGHGVCIINGLADNKQYITGGAAYTVSILPVTSLRDAVAFTNMGKWSIAHGSNELKFTPTSDMEAFLGDLMSISFAI